MILPMIFVTEYPEGVFRWKVSIHGKDRFTIPDLLYTVYYRNSTKFILKSKRKLIPKIGDLLEYDTHTEEWNIVKII